LLPISLYGAGKLACEGLISAYCHLFDIQAWIFRFGNVVGTRMGHGIIHDFIEKLRRSPKELEILGDGRQEKNYFLVEDCIDGMLFAFSKSSAQECAVFNLGCESTVTATKIAHIVAEEMGLGDVRFRYTGGERGWPGDVPVVIYNVDKMKQLGWQAKHTSAEAVRTAARRLLKRGAPALRG
jgi:UDP-glucose 4-epimerase